MPTASQSAGVLSFEQARQTVIEFCRQLGPPLSQEVPLLNALGRVLAEPVHADRDFPPFPRSTRDGYAVRSADVKSVPVKLSVIGQIKAGASFNKSIHSGQAVEIMTGAAVPEGADTVVMLEYTAQRGENEIEIQRAGSPGENIVSAGAEGHAGEEILPRGMRMGAAQIAMAAGAGQASLAVFLRPRVAILSTGDELVEVADRPGPFQIRNSNSYSLTAQVAVAGGDPMRLPIAPDEPERLAALLRTAMAADMLLVSGGVSMGKFDLVETVLAEIGAEFFFTGALIQPGRPVVFGKIPLSRQARTAGSSDAIDEIRLRRSSPIPIFGLPGNPISAMVCFELFARPVLDALGGAAPRPLPAARARLTKEIRTKTGLTRFLPAVLQGELHDPEVEVVPWQGSGDLLAAARANCYLVVPPDRDSLAAGEMVSIVMR